MPTNMTNMTIFKSSE